MGSTSSTTTWRPPQWNGGTATYSIQTAQVPLTADNYVSGSNVIAGQGGAGNEVTSATYVFDAVLVASHRQEVVVTKYPVQTGANISYHSYIMPAQVTLEIGMSDAMDAFVAGVWTGAPTKSASAFQVLSSIKNARQPLLLSTRLFTYDNMVITSISAEETSKTTSALRARITFEEIFVANDSSTAGTASARPQDTQSTPQGTASGQQPDSTVVQQYGAVIPGGIGNDGTIPGGGPDWVFTGSNAGTTVPGGNAIGAGGASSVPNSNLPATGGS